MEVEYSKEAEEEGVILQSDFVKYEEAYIINHSQIYDMFSLIETISIVLEGIIRETDKHFDSTTTAFHAKMIPDIRIRDYLYRIVKCSECSTESLVLALIYIDRLIEKNNGFLIKSLNIHRILLTAIMLAAKFFDDFFYSNGYYAKIGGIANSEMNALEIEFLNSINFSLHVDPIIFFRYLERMMSKR